MTLDRVAVEAGTDAEGLRSDCALRIRELTKSYGATVALRDVSLEVRHGEIHALLGENGAGKSTLVKILSGIIMPDSGRVEIESIPFRPHSLILADGRAGGRRINRIPGAQPPAEPQRDRQSDAASADQRPCRAPVKANRQAATAVLGK